MNAKALAPEAGQPQSAPLQMTFMPPSGVPLAQPPVAAPAAQGNMMYYSIWAHLNQYQQFLQQVQDGGFPAFACQPGQTQPPAAMPAMFPRPPDVRPALPQGEFRPTREIPAPATGSKELSPTRSHVAAKDRYSPPPAEDEPVQTPLQDSRTRPEPVSRRPVQPKPVPEPEPEVVVQKNLPPIEEEHPQPAEETKDEVPIKGSTKTFEQLLEEKLDPGTQEAPRPAQKAKKSAKKQFLKRRSQAVKPPVQARKFNYYVDNFKPGEGKEEEPAPQSPEEKPLPKPGSRPARKLPAAVSKSAALPPKQGVAKKHQNSAKKSEEGFEGSAKKAASSIKFPTREEVLSRDVNYDSLESGPRSQPQPQAPLPAKEKEPVPASAPTLAAAAEFPANLTEGTEVRESVAEFEQLEAQCKEETGSPMANVDIQVRPPAPTPAGKREVDPLTEQARALLDSCGPAKKEETLMEERDSEKGDAKTKGKEAEPEEEEEPKPKESEPVAEAPEQREAESEKDEEKVEEKEDLNSEENPSDNKGEDVDKEIALLQEERGNVERQKQDYDSLFKKLQEEAENFEKYKEEQMAAIKEDREQQSKKLKQERRVLERQLKAEREKKERDELDVLNKENAKLREESKAKDVKYKASLERMKKQIEELAARNSELENRIKDLQCPPPPQIQLAASIEPPEEPEVGSCRVKGVVRPDPKAKYSTRTQAEVRGQKKSAATQKTKGAPAKIGGKPVPVQKTQPRTKPKATEAKRDRKLRTAATAPVPEERAAVELEPEGEEEAKEGGSSGSNADVGNEYEANVAGESHQRDEADEEERDSAEDPTQSKQKDEIGEDEDSEKYDMVFMQKYHDKEAKVVNQRVFNDGKVSKTFDNGKTEVAFANGVKRETFSDGYTVIYFNNKDIKQAR